MPGMYNESVTVTKSIDLIANFSMGNCSNISIINAEGFANGITITN